MDQEEDLTRAAPWPLLATLALPTAWLVQSWPGALSGRFSVDLAGHVWTTWSVANGPVTRTAWANWPHGLDLMPILGGWADVLLGSLLVPLVGPVVALSAVAWLYLVLAGAGGYALGRTAGASAGAAAVAGMVLQVDGFVLHHLMGGRLELVGVGLVALALAAAIRAWREPGWRWPLAAGLAGAAVVWASWELALWLAAAAITLLPVLATGPRVPGAWRRWLAAGAVTAALAGPWAALFLVRAAGVRALADAPPELVAGGSVGALGWLLPSQPRPAWAALAGLALLPWAAPRAQRRLAWWGALGAAACLVLALGPRPGIFAPGEAPWGPFAALVKLPVLGWFHLPDRLLVGLGLAAAAGTALLVDRAGAWRRGAGAALGALVVLGAVAEAAATGHWPRGAFSLEPREEVRRLAELPWEGAVLDLPIARDPGQALRYQLLQLEHRRPVHASMGLTHLVDEDAGTMHEPVLAHLSELADSSASGGPPLRGADIARLRELGFAYVVVHQRKGDGDRRAVVEALRGALGQPVLREGRSWAVWAVPEAP